MRLKIVWYFAAAVAEGETVPAPAARKGSADRCLSDCFPLSLLTVPDIEKAMKTAAQALDFETAAHLRDEIGRLNKLLIAGSRRYKV